MLLDVIWWFDGGILGGKPVPADNVFERWSGSYVLHNAVDGVLALVRGWGIG